MSRLIAYCLLVIGSSWTSVSHLQQFHMSSTQYSIHIHAPVGTLPMQGSCNCFTCTTCQSLMRMSSTAGLCIDPVQTPMRLDDVHIVSYISAECICARGAGSGPVSVLLYSISPDDLETCTRIGSLCHTRTVSGIGLVVR